MSRSASPLLAAAAALTLALTPERASAGPWVPEAGHGYAKLNLRYLFGWGFHPQGGGTENLRRYHEAFVGAYGEVGLGHRIALTLHSDLARTFTLRNPRTGERSAFVAPGDPALGMRVALRRRQRFVVSAEGSVRAPLATAREVATVYETGGSEAEIGRLRVGPGVFDLSAGLSAGYGFDRAYLAGGVAYVGRFEGYRDALHGTLEAGGRFGRGRKWSARGRVTVHPTFGTRTGRAALSVTPSGQGNGTQYAGFAFECERRIGEHLMIGGAVQGGFGMVRQQAGGPVLDAYVAAAF